MWKQKFYTQRYQKKTLEKVVLMREKKSYCPPGSSIRSVILTGLAQKRPVRGVFNWSFCPTGRYYLFRGFIYIFNGVAII